MRRWGMGKWGLAVCVGLAAGAVARAADPDDAYVDPSPPPARVPPNQRPGLIDYMFGPKTPPPKPAPPPSRGAKDKPVKSTAESKEERPPRVTQAEREQEAFLRRLAVCDRLREVAEETKDEKLRQLADQLQDRAWQLCVQRANLDTAGVDETVLNHHLGQSDAAGSLTPPARSTAETQTNLRNQARLKENVP